MRSNQGDELVRKSIQFSFQIELQNGVELKEVVFLLELRYDQYDIYF